MQIPGSILERKSLNKVGDGMKRSRLGGDAKTNDTEMTGNISTGLAVGAEADMHQAQCRSYTTSDTR